jgi:ribonuclease D
METGGDSSSAGQRPKPPRFGHRSHSHDNAHADSSLAQLASETDPNAPQQPSTLIDTQPQLLEFVAHLRSAKSFAFDSEFIGELSYIPKLCLIQAATTTQVALIDPLASLDLKPFWELLADPSVEKIVHAGQQDVEPVFRAINRPPANLFDTQIATGFIGLGYPLSLSKLVYALAGAKLSKSLTFTHWDRRPLSDYQLRYAADDVRYLPSVRQIIGERLEQLNHTAWAQEESATLADPEQFSFDPDTQCSRIRGAIGLAPRNQAVLRELAIWRDGAARHDDLPPRSMLKDEVLLALARAPVRSVAELARVRGLPRPVETDHGPQIVAATARALALPDQKLPPAAHHEPPSHDKFRADGLFFAAQALAAGKRIDPSLVTSRQEVGELLWHVDAGHPFPDLRILRGWRLAAVGQHLLGLIAGEDGFSLHWQNSCLQTTTDEL